MLTNQMLDPIPLWVLFVITIVILLLAIEAGYWVNRAIRRRSPDGKVSGLVTMVSASMVFLAFLLAFTVGFAVSNNGQRRQAVVAEASAIGTLFNRSSFIDELYRTEAQDLLREYTDLRLAAMDPDMRESAVTQTEQIHRQLWASAEKVALEGPFPANTLYVGALDHVIDLHAVRIAAFTDNRVPVTLFLGLYAVAWLTMFMVGMQIAEGERRNYVAQIVLVLILSVAFLLIADLNRAQEGTVWVPQDALLDLQRQLNAGQ
jgi:hypothetical protein